MKECVANGSSACHYAPDGPRGEMQCKWCGDPKPSAQEDFMHFFEYEFETGSTLDVLTRRLNDVGGAAAVREFDNHIKSLMRRYADLVVQNTKEDA